MSSIRGYFSSNGRMSFLVPAKAPCDRVSGGPGMMFRPWVGRWSPHVPFFPFGHLTVCYWTSPFLWIGHIYIIVTIGHFHPFSFDFRFKMWTKLRNISMEGERGYMFGGYVWWVLWIWHLTCLFWLVVWNIFYFSIHIGNNHPNWLSYFSEGLKPPTSCFKSGWTLLMLSDSTRDVTFREFRWCHNHLTDIFCRAGYCRCSWAILDGLWVKAQL